MEPCTGLRNYHCSFVDLSPVSLNIPRTETTSAKAIPAFTVTYQGSSGLKITGLLTHSDISGEQNKTHNRKKKKKKYSRTDDVFNRF